MADNLWRQVLEQHYGLTGMTLLSEIKSHNTHYRITSDSTGDLILSRREILGGAARFRFVQRLLGELRPHLTTLQSPLLTKAGLPYVSRHGQFWQLAAFVESDNDADWANPALIKDAAYRLAEFHEIAARHRITFPFAQEDLDSFEWSMHELDRYVDGYLKRFVRSGQYDSETVRVVNEYSGHLRRLAGECRDIVEVDGLFGITHQDYRPANLCVSDGKVKYIWDWDLARSDVVLYDVAFASLQFGAREVIFPDFRSDYAEHFIAEYADARGRNWRDPAFRRVLTWSFVAVVLKRLLNGWHVDSRRQVLLELRQVGLVQL